MCSLTLYEVTVIYFDEWGEIFTKQINTEKNNIWNSCDL